MHVMPRRCTPCHTLSWQFICIALAAVTIAAEFEEECAESVMACSGTPASRVYDATAFQACIGAIEGLPSSFPGNSSYEHARRYVCMYWRTLRLWHRQWLQDPRAPPCWRGDSVHGRVHIMNTEFTLHNRNDDGARIALPKGPCHIAAAAAAG